MEAAARRLAMADLNGSVCMIETPWIILMDSSGVVRTGALPNAVSMPIKWQRFCPMLARCCIQHLRLAIP
jgi:hypothetical protein